MISTEACSTLTVLASCISVLPLVPWLLPVEPLFSCCDSSQCSHCSPSSRAADLPPWLLPVEPLFSCCGSYWWLISGCRSIWFYAYMILTRASHPCVLVSAPQGNRTDRMNIDMIKNRFIRLASKVWSE